MGLTDRLKPIDRYQQEHPIIAFAVAVIKKFSDDGGGRLSAVLAYYAFFSLFPLLLVLVTTLGFVLQGDPSTQRSVLNSALVDFPVVGTQIAQNVHSLHGSALALVIGIAGAILAGLGVTQAAQEAFNRIWHVPVRERPDFLKSRVRGLLLLLLLGLLSIASTVLSGAAAAGAAGAIGPILGIVLGLALNFALFGIAFKVLTSRELTFGEIAPGAAVAAIVFAFLQVAGGFLIDRAPRDRRSMSASSAAREPAAREPRAQS